MPEPAYDAVLVLSFGGPEKPDDVIPFLENVLRGRNVPRERMLAVAEHYYHFGGKSPINDQNRALIAGLERELASHGLQLPIYWGNRNWHPLLADTLRQMRVRRSPESAGVRHVDLQLVLGLPPVSGGYRDALARRWTARREIHKLRVVLQSPAVH